MRLDGQQITHQSYLKILERNYDPYTVKKEFKEFFFLAFELNIFLYLYRAVRFKGF